MRLIHKLAPALAAALITSPLAADDHRERQIYRQPHDVPGVSSPPMTARDLVTMPRLGGAVVNDDGLAVFSVTETDPETLARSRGYFVIDLNRDGAQPVQLNLGAGSHSPVFGADGALYWLSDRRTPVEPETDVPYSRVWRAELEDGGVIRGARVAVDIRGTSIDGFKLSPKLNAVAVWAAIPRDCPRFGCVTESQTSGSGRLYEGDGGFYRHWDTWKTPGVYNRAFLFSLEDGQAVGDGKAVDGGELGNLTGNTPTMPFGGGEDIAWAPDGSGVYFVLREAGANEPLSTDLDIYFSPLHGGGPQLLTGSNDATDTGPAPSPDGKHLAYLAMERPGYEADRLVVHLRDLKTGKTRPLTADVDLSFGGLTWSADGSYLLATAADVLDTPVFRIDPKTGKATKLDLMAGNEAHIGNIVPLKGNRLLFTRDSIGVPSELYLSDSMGQARPLTDFVTTRMGSMASTVTTRFSFAGAEGNTVWGQITRLEQQDGPIPAILYIHGGPQGSFNDGWSSRWNPRVLASQGYAVISVDFHGSAGYGQAFMDAINRDWGGKPLVDLQLGLEAALKLDPQIDGTRACAMGASYGGYMVNWIAGNWPERFDCLVQHDGLFDMRSFYYSTEELWFPRWDFGGSYTEARDTYERWNPVNHVDNWQTPMLVITGERDFRVPYTQGLQSFTALQERGIPSQLLVFPDENHWVLSARNSLQWHETVFAWLDRWLSEEKAAEDAE